MIDSVTRKPLRVETYDPELPYLVVPAEQLRNVLRLFDQNRVRYEVDEETLSMDDGPPMSFVDLARGTNPDEVQRLLDSVG